MFNNGPGETCPLNFECMLSKIHKLPNKPKLEGNADWTSPCCLQLSASISTHLCQIQGRKAMLEAIELLQPLG